MERYAAWIAWVHDMGYTWFDLHRLTTFELKVLQLGHLIRQDLGRPAEQRQHDQRKAAYRRHFGYD